MPKRPRVMLIDDDREMVVSLGAVLERLGCSVTMFSDPGEALNAFEAGETELVFTDLSMPGMSGLDVLKAVHGRDPGAAVVLVTGSVDGEWRNEAEREGIFRILKKPINISMLNGILKELRSGKDCIAPALRAI
jgi:DNA-binding NtrC family response regulator